MFSPLDMVLEDGQFDPFLEEVEAEIHKEMKRSTKQKKVHMCIGCFRMDNFTSAYTL